MNGMGLEMNENNKNSRKYEAQQSKMDILFYNSIRQTRRSNFIRLAYHFLRLALLVVFLPIDVAVLKTTSVVIIVFMAIGIAIVCYHAFVTIGLIKSAYSDNQKNNRFFVAMARKYEHSIAAEPITSGLSFTKLEQCVSKTVYNVASGANINDEGLTEEIKSRYQNIFTNIIGHQVMQNASCIQFLEQKGRFGSFALVIFGIVALSTGYPNSAQLGVLITFIVLQAFNIWMVIVLLIILVLSPLIICGLCCWACCFSSGQRQFQVPPAIQASGQIIQNTQGSCPICFQAFIPKQKVIQLKCSDKHVFHQGCLNKWLLVGRTCPMCRKNIGEQN